LVARIDGEPIPELKEKSMAEAVIVEAVRAPVGKRNGGLSGVHPAELSAQVLNGLVERAGVDPEIIDDVIKPRYAVLVG
jgi:acetyl-CoA acetyltransferase